MVIVAGLIMLQASFTPSSGPIPDERAWPVAVVPEREREPQYFGFGKLCSAIGPMLVETKRFKDTDQPWEKCTAGPPSEMVVPLELVIAGLRSWYPRSSASFYEMAAASVYEMWSRYLAEDLAVSTPPSARHVGPVP